MSNELDKIDAGQNFYCVDNVTNEKRRAMKEQDGRVFVFNHRSRRYGHRWEAASFEQNYSILPVKDPTAEWHRRLQRALRAMDSSGLWDELKVIFTNLLQMTWKDHQTMAEAYWKGPYPRRYDTEEWEKWYQKYPFLKITAENGAVYPNTDYLFEISCCNLKSMYFGKDQNITYKERIAHAINDQVPCILRARTNYDVSYEFDPSKKKAWYSEEYKNCGNGHYYLALDHSTALFCEND